MEKFHLLTQQSYITTPDASALEKHQPVESKINLHFIKIICQMTATWLHKNHR